jgi:hypothetical protein
VRIGIFLSLHVRLPSGPPGNLHRHHVVWADTSRLLAALGQSQQVHAIERIKSDLVINRKLEGRDGAHGRSPVKIIPAHVGNVAVRKT